MNTTTNASDEVELTAPEKFAKFNAENPWVLISLMNLTIDLMNRGRTVIGMGMLFEVLRWDHLMKTNGTPFKLNNNYRAYYSRLIEGYNPKFKDIFTKRGSQADNP